MVLALLAQALLAVGADGARLLGTVWLERNPSSDVPDWLRQPDRVVSALVARCGADGEEAAKRAALECLEAQEPPRLPHVEANPGEAPTVSGAQY